MKKSFRMKNLDCADCALKMERAICKINGVNSASMNFIFQKLILDYDECKSEDIYAQIKDVISKVDSDCEVIGMV